MLKYRQWEGEKLRGREAGGGLMLGEGGPGVLRRRLRVLEKAHCLGRW